MPLRKQCCAFTRSRHYSILYPPLFDSLPTKRASSSILYTPFFASLPTKFRYSTHRHAKTGQNYRAISTPYELTDSRNTFYNTNITPSFSGRAATISTSPLTADRTRRHRHPWSSWSRKPQGQRTWKRCWLRNEEASPSGKEPERQHPDRTMEDGF